MWSPIATIIIFVKSLYNFNKPTPQWKLKTACIFRLQEQIGKINYL